MTSTYQSIQEPPEKQTMTAHEIKEIIITVPSFTNVLTTEKPERDNAWEIKGDQTYEPMAEDGSTTSRVTVYPSSSNSKPATNYTCMKISGDGPITLVFKIVGAPPGDVYHPFGIAFTPVTSDSRYNDIFGLKNFPPERIQISEGSISVTDMFLPELKGAKYKFSISLQNKNGEIALIDPTIEHIN